MTKKVDSFKGPTSIEAQDLVMFDVLFKIDQQRDFTDIKKMIGRVRKNPMGDRIGLLVQYENDKKNGHLKYTTEQLESGQWESDDFALAIETLRNERIENYFRNILNQYEEYMPIPDSIVRLDQESAIAKALRSHKPVLIRGNWRIGKTSMLRSLEKHHFGTGNTLFIDVGGENIGQDKPPDELAKQFCLTQIASLIAKRELKTTAATNISDITASIIKQIKNSKKSAFEFLNDYLAKQGQKVFISLDEVMGFTKKPERLSLLASLKGLSNIHLAIALHRLASFDDLFKNVFKGFETYFMRQLTLKEVGLLVRKPLEGTKISFTDAAIWKIFEFTGGRPMEVNNICHALISQFSKPGKYKFTYHAQDIDAFTRKNTFQFEGDFVVAIRNYKTVYELAMSDEERRIINKLVKIGEIPVSEIDPEIVKPLLDTTFVVKDKSRGTYRINGELFKRVIADLIDN